MLFALEVQLDFGSLFSCAVQMCLAPLDYYLHEPQNIIEAYHCNQMKLLTFRESSLLMNDGRNEDTHVCHM